MTRGVAQHWARHLRTYRKLTAYVRVGAGTRDYHIQVVLLSKPDLILRTLDELGAFLKGLR